MPPNQAQRIAYAAKNFGVFFHWNMSTFVDMQNANPNLNVDTFAPTGLDIDQWLDAAVTAGANTAALTVKHHDGFCLWATAFTVPTYDPYSIASTAWYTANGNPDVVSLFVTKCRTRNLLPVLYFSVKDHTYEVRSGNTPSSNPTAYIAMVKAQLTELLSNYGAITAIWTDGWGHSGNPPVGYTNIPYSTLADHIHGLQPNCLVCENNHEHPTVNSDIEVWETTVPTQADDRYQEHLYAVRLNGNWFYEVSDDQSASALYTAAQIQAKTAYDILYNTTLSVVNFSPTTAGVLPAAQVMLLGEIGA